MIVIFKKSDFSVRATVCFFIIIFLFLGCVLRVTVISSSGKYAELQKEQSTKTVSVGQLRGTVYDCNLKPLTNNKSEKYTAFPLTENALLTVSEKYEGKEQRELLSSIKSNGYGVIKTEKRLNVPSAVSTTVQKTDNETAIANHIIGYVDSSGHGVCGIQKAYDGILYSNETVNAVFSVNGKGNLLYGVEPYFNNNKSITDDGVITTLDFDMQSLAEAIGNKGLIKGAIAISEIKTGKIRAAASFPSYNLNEFSKATKDKNSPLINRCVTAFPVGSVFKPCIAAAALENGMGGFSYTCRGKTHIADRDFSCHKKAGHGKVGLTDALALSCNTFFYNLGLKAGGEKLCETAAALGFGMPLRIGKNLRTDSGNITEKAKLQNEGLLADFSIGQGDILLSPFNMLTLYQAIANKGEYYLPHIVEGVRQNGNFVPYNYGAKTKVMSEKTADTIKSALRLTVTKGTGKDAESKKVTSAGKTATAQTGKYYKNGVEITNSWFCGFFPYENPKYAVVIMAEGESKISTAEIFKELTEKCPLK